MIKRRQIWQVAKNKNIFWLWLQILAPKKKRQHDAKTTHILLCLISEGSSTRDSRIHYSRQQQQQPLSWAPTIAAWKRCVDFASKRKTNTSLSVCIYATLYLGAQLELPLPQSNGRLNSTASVWVTSGTSAASSSHLANSRRPPVTQSNLLLHHINVPACLVYPGLCSALPRVKQPGSSEPTWRFTPAAERCMPPPQ